MTCTIDGCTRPHEARGWCIAHYSRFRRHGDPLGGRTPDGTLAEFVAAVLAGTAPREPNGCIIWPYGVANGYPRIYVDGVARSVGQLVLEHFAGERPSDAHTVGHALHEICGHRRCVAPEHLSWQTMSEQICQQVEDGTHRSLKIGVSA